MSQRHTTSFLKQRFAEVGIRPLTKYGQNFLIDLNLQDLLVRSAELDEHDVVLEVGTGTGALTAELARVAAEVVTIEVDPNMHQLAQEELINFENVTALHFDALKNKNHLRPELLNILSERLAAGPNRRLKLVANLPYNIATPVISNLLDFEPRPALMAVTIQKELADRIAAVPRTKDYSALSVWVQSQARVELVRVMPPEVFWPRPKVNSAILRIIPDESLRRRIPNVPFFHRFVRAIFFHRRKFLRANLIAAFKGLLEKPDVDQVLEPLSIGPEARSEELTVEQMITLSEAFRARVGDEALK